MSIVLQNGFPINLIPNAIKSSKVLLPTDMQYALDHDIGAKSPYVFFDIIMRQFNFPFFPYVFDDKVTILFGRYMNEGKIYVTSEFKKIDISYDNIRFIQNLIDNCHSINRQTYNNIIYQIISRVFHLKFNNFAVYGCDNAGNTGYLSFTTEKVPVFNIV